MGDHIDNRKNGPRRKKGFYEAVDPLLSRRRRVTFKNYLREVEEELLEDELDPVDTEAPIEEDEDPIPGSTS